ncbi:hypothetical protein DFH07DRAFT_817753 [Mycena maculata]|uniref:Uncharacterized protein n=1 Tax=Mycena maculata TaxID=230809 RepID=A0AAD7JAB9_9AGAR|nr:hypothetical protein DFH07DRAFT_817753 [Mycena maculata]
MSPPWANLAGLAIGGLFYGMYLVLYLTSTYLLFRRSSGAHAGPVYRSIVFISGLILFVAVTGNWALTVARPFLGFIVFLDGTAAPKFFNDNSQITTTVQNIFAALSILIGDGMIIYRLWIVWSRNKFIIILPILTLIGLLITLVLSVQTTTHVNNIAEDKGLTPGLIFTLVTNIYCTGLTSWKIWQITRGSSPVNGNNMRDFIGIIIESSALYSGWAIFYIITHQINADVQFVALIAVPAVAGISHALIQARISMGQTVERTHLSARASSSAPLRLTTRLRSDAEASRTDILETKSVNM